MERNTPQMKLKYLLLTGLVGIGALVASPTPMPNHRHDLSEITQADIDATIAHRNQLQTELQGKLGNAGSDVKQAAQHTTELQGQIDALAKSAVRDREANLKCQAHAAHQTVIIILLGLAIAGYVALKFSPLGKFI